jgi:hypothetical protein
MSAGKQTVRAASTPPIRSWSYSRLLDFEACPHKAFLKIVQRIPDPSGAAADRGTAVHLAAELFVKGEGDFTAELKHFKPELEALRREYKAGKVSLEGEWATNQDWSAVDWKGRDAWCRMKLDGFVWRTKTQGLVIDYKTGKLFGNEVKHAEQGQLYAVGAFMRYPQLEVADVEFWYFDKDDLTHVSYTRKQATQFAMHFHKRGEKMTSAVNFPPRPNMFSCKWCPYSPRAGEQCKAGV